MSCSAYDDHGTGTMVCNRCGYQWDANDPDPPPCKTWDEINQDKTDHKEREFNQSREHGRSVLAKLREDLKQ